MRFPRRRRTVFGQDPETYDRARPHYPRQLVHDVLAYAAPRRAAAVEVGAGTGKATEAFVRNGVRLTCLEPDARMAGVLARRFAGSPAVDVVVSGFEEWPASTAPPVDLVLSAQAWHWVDPAVRWTKAHRLLVPGGVLALWWIDLSVSDPGLNSALAEAHERNGCGPLGAHTLGPILSGDDWPLEQMTADGLFTDPVRRSYREERLLPPGRYVDLLASLSGYRALDAGLRTRLLGELRTVLDGCRSVRVATATRLFMGRAAPGAPPAGHRTRTRPRTGTGTRPRTGTDNSTGTRPGPGPGPGPQKGSALPMTLTSPDSPGSAPSSPSDVHHRSTDSELRLTTAALQSVTRRLHRLAAAAESALRRHPGEPFSPGSEAFADLASRAVPRWHFAMLNDTERNDALVRAIEQHVTPDSLVLDIGTGSGLLAMAAVRAGAGQVVSCEENPLLAEVARQVVAAHGMSGRVTVLTERSTGLGVGRGLPRRADLVVAEVVGSALIDEGLLPTVRHARAELLAPDGVLLPGSARVYGQLLHCDAAIGLGRVQGAAGFDVSLMNVAAAQGHYPLQLRTYPHELLSDPVEILAFALRSGAADPGGKRLSLDVTRTGEAQALLVWFEAVLGESAEAPVLSNSPARTASHWEQAVVPFPVSVPVKSGDRLGIDLTWTDHRLTAQVTA
ncbi:methyltransferase domain-containing protein [Streptomyces albus subsp. chlorinus]|uniref:methyltransferase domain-containing protein n=1 Tax=Streptomyces albus TaxID=1888 RepID=UPI00156F9124|nr:methyltransferase domain-containing protein [Streptomyces albus]